MELRAIRILTLKIERSGVRNRGGQFQNFEGLVNNLRGILSNFLLIFSRLDYFSHPNQHEMAQCSFWSNYFLAFKSLAYVIYFRRVHSNVSSQHKKVNSSGFIYVILLNQIRRITNYTRFLSKWTIVKLGLAAQF